VDDLTLRLAAAEALLREAAEAVEEEVDRLLSWQDVDGCWPTREWLRAAKEVCGE